MHLSDTAKDSSRFFKTFAKPVLLFSRQSCVNFGTSLYKEIRKSLIARNFRFYFFEVPSRVELLYTVLQTVT